MNKVIEILAEYTDVDASKIREDSTLVSDLGLTSLDVLDMVSAFEDAYDIEIPDKDIKGFETVHDIIVYLSENTDPEN